MPKGRTPKFSYVQTESGWKVEIPRTISTSGRRERHFFATRDKARDYAEELAEKHRKVGANMLTITPSLAEMATKAAEVLAPTGMTLLEAANACRARWDATRQSKPLGEAVAAFLTSRENLRESTLKSYRYSLEKILSPLLKIKLSDIGHGELAPLLADKGATARQMHHRNFSVFWKWASSPPRSWTTMDAVRALEAPRVSSDADIHVLRPSDVRALLAAAEIEGHACAASYSIAVFAGVRMAELERLVWANIGDEYIEIGKSVAKKHSRRLVPICPTLAAWLTATRGNADNDSLIVPPNWADVSKSVRRRAGWDVEARLLTQQVKSGKLDELAKPTRGKWPANACRHTCASVQVAIGTPLDDLTFKFGHSGGHDLLRRHYVARMTKRQALEILSIGPNGTQVSGIQAA